MTEGVSFVVPVHNGAAYIRETLESIRVQADGRPMEIIVVDDCSRDGSSTVIRNFATEWPLVVVPGEGRGAAAAINAGIRAARFPIICQVDQDVVLRPGWMAILVAHIEDRAVGAAQGCYVRDAGMSLCARAMALDLEQRYSAIQGRDTDQVCTGNAAYRAEALQRIGLFDETLGYGYDNDLSYRLRAAGYRLIFCSEAQSAHRWREGLIGYLVQQYGFGYGRLELVAKHPSRITGDLVSPVVMMAHPVVLLAALACLTAAAVAAAAGAPWQMFAATGVALMAFLVLERLLAGLNAVQQFRVPTPLVFPLLHLARDLAWVVAILAWTVRKIARQPPLPSHSMRPRGRGREDFSSGPDPVIKGRF